MARSFSFLRRIIIFVLALFLFSNSCQKKESLFANEKTAETSAYLNFEKKSRDIRKDKLKAFLKSRRSPIANYAFFIIETADRYNLDWRLLPAITGVESNFGIALPINSFNAYGWDGGRYYFKSWPDGIKHVSVKLKQNYLDQGAKTVDQIGLIYAESPNWAERVKEQMDEIDRFNPFPLLFSL